MTVMYGINDGCSLFGLCMVNLSLLIGCRGVDLRNIHRLTLISKIVMSSDLNTHLFGNCRIEGFKYNRCGSCKLRSIQLVG